jgi:hypothetical protein
VSRKRPKEKEGDTCPSCGEKLRLVRIRCEGARKRHKRMPTILACRCLHPGDLMCNCGNPCWSIF